MTSFPCRTHHSTSELPFKSRDAHRCNPNCDRGEQIENTEDDAKRSVRPTQLRPDPNRLKCSEVRRCFLTQLIYFLLCRLLVSSPSGDQNIKTGLTSRSWWLCTTRSIRISRRDLHKLAFPSSFGLLQQAIALINSFSLSYPPTSYLSDADCRLPSITPPLILPPRFSALCTCTLYPNTLIISHVWHI